MINRSTKQLQETLWSAPNLPGRAQNLINTKAARIDNDQWMGRVDHRFGDNNILTGPLQPERFGEPPPHRPPLGRQPAGHHVHQHHDQRHAHREPDHDPGHEGLLPSKQSPDRPTAHPGARKAIEGFITGNSIQGIPVLKSKAVPLFPQWSIPGFASPSQTGFPFPDDSYSAYATITKIAGGHTIKAWFEFKHSRNLDDGYFTGNMSFDKVPTEDPQNAAATSNAVASYLLGLPTIARRTIGEGTTAIMRKEDYSLFFQDDWRATANLTVNLGLRYDMSEWPKHRDDLLASIDLGTGQFLWDGHNPITGEGPNVRRGIVEPDNNNFAPRVGMAYRLGGKDHGPVRIRRLLHDQLSLGGAERARQLAVRHQRELLQSERPRACQPGRSASELFQRVQQCELREAQCGF